MTGDFWLIKNMAEWSHYYRNVTQACAELLAGGPIAIKLSRYKHPRSVDQNALQHVWYAEIEQQGGELSARDARRLCKLTIGVPILRGGDTEASEKFRELWDRVIRPRLSYEEKLEIMDWVPVTSLMNAAQMHSFLTTMQETFAAKGIRLAGIERGQDQYPEARA